MISYFYSSISQKLIKITFKKLKIKEYKIKFMQKPLLME